MGDFIDIPDLPDQYSTGGRGQEGAMIGGRVSDEVRKQQHIQRVLAMCQRESIARARKCSDRRTSLYRYLKEDAYDQDFDCAFQSSGAMIWNRDRRINGSDRYVRVVSLGFRRVCTAGENTRSIQNEGFRFRSQRRPTRLREKSSVDASVWPLMKEAPSLRRNSTAEAKSSDVPMRRNG